MRVRIDVGGATFLPMCGTCGWRGLPAESRTAALHEARHHEMRAHPGDNDVAKALYKSTTRP